MLKKTWILSFIFCLSQLSFAEGDLPPEVQKLMNGDVTIDITELCQSNSEVECQSIASRYFEGHNDNIGKHGVRISHLGDVYQENGSWYVRAIMTKVH